MNLWEILCEIAEIDGFNLKFNLTNKSIKYKRKYLIKEGKVVADSVTDCNGKEYVINADNIIGDTGDVYAEVQRLYDAYVISRPSKVNRRSIFRAKKSDELSYDQLLNGEDREQARCKLEGFIVLTAMVKRWNWNNLNYWFWVGNNGLVLYKDWVIGGKS